MSDIEPDKLPDTKEIPHIEHERYEKAVRVLTESGQSWKKRNKLIRIADKSEGGWKTVEEYLSDDVANDDDDERIRAAYDRAVKKLKTVKQDKRQNIKKRPAESAGGPLSIAHNGNNGGFSQQQPFLVAGAAAPSHLVGTELGTSVTTVVCMDIGQKTYLIENGYKIPLITEPESVLLRNNKSALEHKDFVEKAVQELIDASLIKEVSNRPHVVNPLTVSINSSGKGRLILDLRHVNKQVVYSKIKFEDWKTASQFLTSDCFGFAFDLKAGYHHINIFPNHQKYLGFSWKFGETVKYFVFTVLPFGLCSAGYVFTKVVRPLIAHWRKDGIKITVYLDDGLCLAETEKLCCEQSVRVKKRFDIVRFCSKQGQVYMDTCSNFSLAWFHLEFEKFFDGVAVN
ncbi:Hypothetical predicted protein [Mytilus galloprovincialis]|uniref:Reverse transcriptase domain-containing protein n=1 Tax=Mytilus galloprovincialis TaxID=29158 RepID=A0A8B6GX39_MYTGA|nr:Hypothetical predicted protein [Mytilus galloprovincialis]